MVEAQRLALDRTLPGLEMSYADWLRSMASRLRDRADLGAHQPSTALSQRLLRAELQNQLDRSKMTRGGRCTIIRGRHCIDAKLFARGRSGPAPAVRPWWSARG